MTAMEALWFLFGVLTILPVALLIAASATKRPARPAYPQFRDIALPVPVCTPDRHAPLTAAYQVDDEIEQDEDEELPAPLATMGSHYDVTDRFAWLEVAE